MKFLFFLVLLMVLPGAVSAQPSAPLFETRAVWFATVLRDGGWPVAGSDAATQAADLRARIQEAHAWGLNTFVFQAVARGDALYPSARLPWSPQPGEAGVDPGYDPLAVAVDEAHRLGMELHAWINVFRIGDTTTRTRFEQAPGPRHVLFEHPDWTRQQGTALWIDPADDAARQWLVENTLEIVRNYDVDAVHFDFIRYPEGGFATDGDRFQDDPDNVQFASIDDWRRDNVTQFVRDVSAAVLAEKPWVKIGATPLGNYRDNGWPALFAFSGVFQESRRWLQDGLADYLAPQIYWAINANSATLPRFDVLAREWVAESAGRSIFAGIGAYKNDVQAEIAAEIDTTRAAGAAGQVFFRYDHLQQVASAVQSRYVHPALPAPMAHRFEAAAPTTPSNLRLDAHFAVGDPGAEVTLAWAPAEGTAADPLRAYAIFLNVGAPPDADDPAHLLAVVSEAQTTYEATFAERPELPVFFRVRALSRLGAASAPSAAVSLDLHAAAVEPGTPPATFHLEPAYPNPARDAITILFETEVPTAVSVMIYDTLGRHVATLAERRFGPGPHRLRADVFGWPAGVYACVLRAGAHRRVRNFIVVR